MGVVTKVKFIELDVYVVPSWVNANHTLYAVVVMRSLNT